MLTNYQKAASLYVNLALGCIDTLKQLAKPKSAEWNRLTGAEEVLMRCLETYRLESFPVEDANNAAAIIDLINAEVNRLYPAEGDK